jgi:hypothetical protein
VSPSLSHHVSSDRLGEAARHASFDSLRDDERRHFDSCPQCHDMYDGYRLTDRLLASPWREVKLPAVEQPSRIAALTGFLGDLSPRSFAPALLALALVGFLGVSLVLPQVLPVGGPSVSSSPSPSPSQLATDQTPEPSASEPGTDESTGPGPAGSGSGGKKTPKPTTPGTIALSPVTFDGTPIGWAPDSEHLLVAAGHHKIVIRDAAGKLIGSATGDGAAWVDADTVAIATISGGHDGNYVTVGLYDVTGHRNATLPGKYSYSTTANVGRMLIGSGTGRLAIANQAGTNSSDWTFVVWAGHSLSASHHGIPVAFSRDGRLLAVLRPGGILGDTYDGHDGFAGDQSGAGFGRVNPARIPTSGALEVLSVPDLHTSASFPQLSLRLDGAISTSGYGYDAAFSPNGGGLLLGDTLIDLHSGSSVRTGRGGWLPDGSLITSSGKKILRWQGTGSTVEPRLPGGGVIGTSGYGDVIDYFTDGRAPTLLMANGTVRQLSLPGIASIDFALISPDGQALAIDGKKADRRSVAAVAALP